MARKPFDFAAEGITAEEWKAMTVKEKGRVRSRVHARAKRASMTPEQRSEIFKKARNRDSYRAWRSEHLKKPEVKQRAAERNRKRWLEMPDEKKEELEAKRNEYRQSPEGKAKRNEYKRRRRALIRAQIAEAQAKAAAERRKFYHHGYSTAELLKARKSPPEFFTDDGEAWRYEYTHSDGEGGAYDMLYRPASTTVEAGHVE